MLLWLFIALILLIILLELPPLLRERQYREIAVFTAFILAGFYLGMVQLFNWPFYNPIIELLGKL